MKNMVMLPLKKIIAETNLSVPCPFCSARLGECCTNSEGSYLAIAHDSRIEAACKRIGDKMPPMGVWAGMDRRRRA